MTTTVRIDGLAELERALRQFPVNLQRRALGAAMRAGAREITKEVKARAPVRTGALKRNVLAKRGRAQFDRGLVARQIVGVRHGRVKTRGKLSAYDKRGNDPFYYRFQELGFTAVGRRKAANRSERRARKVGRGTVGRKIAGRGFLKQGAQTAAPRAFTAIRDRLRTEIDKL